MSPLGMHALLDQTMRRVRRDSTLAVVAAVAIVVPVLLLLAWLLGGSGWARPSVGPLALELAALVTAIAIGMHTYRRWLAGVQEAAIARTAETGLSLPEGSVRGMLELRRLVPSGTSPALFRQAEGELAGRFAGRSITELAGPLGSAARRRRGRLLAGLGLALVAVAALGFISPERSRASWTPLLSPVANLTPPPLPALVVEPGNASVPRGGSLDVTVRAGGRAMATLHWRAQGDVPRRLELSVRADTTRGTIAPVDAALTYWVTVPDGAVSDTFRVEPADPLLVSELVVTVDYPGYLERPSERYATDVPPLQLPEGTRLTIEGQGTRPLAMAALRSENGEVALTVDGERFAGRWTPTVSGTYAWQFAGRSGEGAGSSPMPLEITVVPDSPPQVELAYPMSDTVLPPEMVQAVVAEARDDYGLDGAWLVSWRVSSAGRAESPLELAVPLAGDPDRAALRALLDARDRGLMPGDTLKMFVRVRDGSPRGQESVSRTIALRLPGRPEMRRRADDLADEAAEQSANLAQAAADLEQATRNLERRTAANNARRSSGGGGGQPGDASSMGFEETEESRRVLEQQEELVARAEQLREQLESLQRSMEMAGLSDAAMQEKMQELQELYDQILTPEMREKMEQLREALAKRNPEDVQKALEELTRQQEQFREQLERSMEMMKRVAAEQEMAALAQEAKELSTQQEALADEMRDAPPTEEEQRQQEELRERTSQLAELLEKLGQDLGRQGQQEGEQKTEQAAQGAGEAEQEMRDAAQAAQQGNSQEAAERGQRAADKLDEVASGLESARSEMADQRQREVQESLERATADALALAERQQALQESMEQAQQAGLPKPQPPQPGQQGAQQQGQQGQQQGGQQQQQGGQQQGGQQQQQGGQKDGPQQGQQQGGQQQGGQQGSGQGASDLSSMRAEQQALQQGLQQLGRNLSETGEQSPALNRDVSEALGRSNLSMQETMQGLQQAGETGRMPTDEAGRSVEALNNLALSLLDSSQQMQQAQGGTGMQQALQDLANLAQQQGSLNGQTSSLMPLNLGEQSMSRQLQQLAQEQRSIAQKLGGMNQAVGGREELLGDLDALSNEAEQLARALEGGRLPPEVMERQERLFHRLLDAGRSLEKEETSDERVAERPGAITPADVAALDAAMLDNATRFRTPTPEELRSLPPAYRRLVLEYFERLNRAADRGRP